MMMLLDDFTPDQWAAIREAEEYVRWVYGGILQAEVDRKKTEQWRKLRRGADAS